MSRLTIMLTSNVSMLALASYHWIVQFLLMKTNIGKAKTSICWSALCTRLSSVSFFTNCKRETKEIVMWFSSKTKKSFARISIRFLQKLNHIGRDHIKLLCVYVHTRVFNTPLPEVLISDMFVCQQVTWTSKCWILSWKGAQHSLNMAANPGIEFIKIKTKISPHN